MGKRTSFYMLLRRIFTIICTVYLIALLVVFTSVCFPPDQFWPAGVLSLSAPVLSLVAIGLGTLQISLGKGYTRWISLPLILSGIFFFLFLFSVSNYWKEAQNGDFSILSYNVSGYKAMSNKKARRELPKWLQNQKANVICLQEYYTGKAFQSFESNFKYKYKEIKSGQVGLGTFSNFPIIDQGKIFDGINIHNKAIFTDLLVNKDTIRVINVHLESYNLQLREQIIEHKNFSYVLSTLKNGQQIRSAQTKLLLNFIDSSPHPIIITGDFNEPPFSYTYLQLRKRLNNAYEERGRGTGFTYKPNSAYLRIDHQFASEEFLIAGFTTQQDVNFSDHVPIIGSFKLR